MSNKNYIIKKYIGENYYDSLTKNKLYKMHSQDENDDIYIFDNNASIKRYDLDDFIDVNKIEYKKFLIQDTQKQYNDCIKRIKEIEDFTYSNDPYYTFCDSNPNLEKKLNRLREEDINLQRLCLYYEMIFEYFNINEGE